MSDKESELSPKPLYQPGDLTLDPDRSLRHYGPFYTDSSQNSAKSLTLAPVFSFRTDTGIDSTEFEFAYPLVTYHRFGFERRLQFLQLFSIAGGMTLDEHPTRRLTLFPIYFHQRSPEPALNYTAVVPFYGRLNNRLFRDEIKFILLPLYIETRKRGVLTQNILYPFFHRRTGPGLRGMQFWPLGGIEHKTPTTKTNGFGEVELVGGHEKFFLLWPLFFRNRLGLGTEAPESQDILLPLYSIQRSPNRDASTYLWPIGPTFINDRENEYREWGFPWPFITFARGDGKTSNRVWPLFSNSYNDTLQSRFFLWPLYKMNRAVAERLDRRRTRIFLFLYSDLIEKNTVAGTAYQRTDLWPLFSAQRDHEGATRLQVLALLEPFLPTSLDIKRLYSPLWTLWSSERIPEMGIARRSFLFNLYRTETTSSTKDCSIFFGLFRYQSGPDGRRWRVFYIPIGKETEN